MKPLKLTIDNYDLRHGGKPASLSDPCLAIDVSTELVKKLSHVFEYIESKTLPNFIKDSFYDKSEEKKG